VLPHLFLEQQAERCIKLAYQCQNRNAERFLRLLAVDLMLAAQLRRPLEPAKPEQTARIEAAQPKARDESPLEAAEDTKPRETANDTAKERSRPEVLSVLATLSRQTKDAAAPGRGLRLTPESASRA
jgi:hypothetical protein